MSTYCIWKPVSGWGLWQRYVSNGFTNHFLDFLLNFTSIYLALLKANIYKNVLTYFLITINNNTNKHVKEIKDNSFVFTEKQIKSACWS